MLKTYEEYRKGLLGTKTRAKSRAEFNATGSSDSLSFGKRILDTPNPKLNINQPKSYEDWKASGATAPGGYAGYVENFQEEEPKKDVWDLALEDAESDDSTESEYKTDPLDTDEQRREDAQENADLIVKRSKVMLQRFQSLKQTERRIW